MPDHRRGIRAVSPSVFFVVAASLALGTALVATDATDYITRVFLEATRGAGPVVILSGLMLLLAVLTNVVSNNAAAVIGTPIAIGIATQLELPPEPFVLAVLFGANMSYATPMAYKTNLLVMSAGGYAFTDFLKVGDAPHLAHVADADLGPVRALSVTGSPSGSGTRHSRPIAAVHGAGFTPRSSGLIPPFQGYQPGFASIDHVVLGRAFYSYYLYYYL